jgi:hypothetical protein
VATEPAEPDPAAYRLSEAEFRDIFETVIVPGELSTGVSQEHPWVLLLGGQVGAGKSVMKGNLTAGSRWSQAVEFGSDTLRAYHPAFERLLEGDADHAGFFTDLDARAWVEDAIDYCLERRFSVVFDSTLSRPHTAESIAGRFRRAGYQLEAAFVAVPPALSRLGIVFRFLESVAERGTGRYALNHEETYAGVIAVAEWVDRNAPFDTVSVYRRRGERLYINETDADGAWVRPPALRQSIEAERTRMWDEREVRAFLTTVDQARHLAESLTMQGAPLDTIWLDRIADAAELATALAGDLRREVAAVADELRRQASHTDPAAAPRDPDLQAAVDAIAISHPAEAEQTARPKARTQARPSQPLPAERDASAGLE